MSKMSETIASLSMELAQLRRESVDANNIKSVNEANGVPCEPQDAVTCVITRPVRRSIASTRKLSKKGIIIPIATTKAMVKKRQQGRKPSRSKCSSVGGSTASVARKRTGRVPIHGAKVTRQRCSFEGCKKCSQKGGVCITHGAKVELKRCKHDGCTSFARVGGVCVTHGSKVKRCSHEKCTNIAVQGGVCRTHGAKVEVKRCSHEGCANKVVKGGVCITHGAKKKCCSHDGCTNFVVKGGVCITHGAKVEKKQCSHVGCKNRVKKGGVCVTHGAKVKRCSYEGCTKYPQGKGGVCCSHRSKIITATNNPAAKEAKTLQIYEDEEELNSWIWGSSRMSMKLA
jgi:hypothetical protein